MDWNWHRLRTNPVDETAYIVAQLGQRWPVVLGAPAVLGGVVGWLLPRRLARRGAGQQAEAVRAAGRQAFAGMAADLVLLAALPRLRLAHAPVRAAWLYLFCGRAAWAALGTALALAARAGGRDLAPRPQRAL